MKSRKLNRQPWSPMARSASYRKIGPSRFSARICLSLNLQMQKGNRNPMELDLTGIIFRVSIMYLYALALVRISGKQTLGQLTPMDFVVTLIIGDLFDDVFWAEVPLIEGIVGF